MLREQCKFICTGYTGFCTGYTDICTGYTDYTGFQSNKESITNSVFSHTKTLTNQQPTYLYNSLSFPSHSVSTRSFDSLVLSIPYVRSSLGKRAFSVIGPRLWNSLPPDTRNLNSLPTFRSRPQNTPLQNCIPSLGSFPSPWTVYPDFDSCYSHFMPYRMTLSIRHRAIEVHYYYYYYFSAQTFWYFLSDILNLSIVF